MTNPRIAPIEPPYTADVNESFDTVMRGAPPLLLFRTVANNPRVLQRMMAGGLLDRGSISLRERELMNLRSRVIDLTWSKLSQFFNSSQLIELVMLAGLYHAVSFTVNALEIQLENLAPRFPEK